MVFSEAMRAAGLISRSIPGERLIYELFSRVGENLPGMMLARQAATAGQGPVARRGAGGRRGRGRRPGRA